MNFVEGAQNMGKKCAKAGTLFISSPIIFSGNYSSEFFFFFLLFHHSESKMIDKWTGT